MKRKTIFFALAKGPIKVALDYNEVRVTRCIFSYVFLHGLSFTFLDQSGHLRSVLLWLRIDNVIAY
ncbi:hypothetical protein TH5_00770 [Thalassospira xianhensis MCCC 1A02616]|uniref:Uncharacterized protein n=1 Tax=Thalassospira xianhensis MCCC 1A02616 TaxID=1177929 RepID=A0A367UI07_9PROT|nr:hypothetical protein TH5_00770 [Thalassospira xianhensis MCCC 1A02616]